MSERREWFCVYCDQYQTTCHSSFYDRESAEDRVRELAGHNPYLVHYREVLPGDIEIINENDLPELTPQEEQATKEMGDDFLAFIRWRKQLGDDYLPSVYNGKTAKEWYERFGLLTKRHAKLVDFLKELERRMDVEWSLSEPRRTELHYWWHLIRAALAEVSDGD